MTSPCEIDFLKWFFAGLGWLVAAVLAIFHNNQNNKRETRKEVKTQIEELKKSSQKIIEAAKDYYLIEDVPKSTSIIAIYEGLNHCGRIIDHISMHGNTNLMHILGNLYDSVTNDPFESKSFTSGQQHLERCKRISHQQTELTRQAEVWFSNTFQSCRCKRLTVKK